MYVKSGTVEVFSQVLECRSDFQECLRTDEVNNAKCLMGGRTEDTGAAQLVARHSILFVFSVLMFSVLIFAVSAGIGDIKTKEVI